MVDVSGVPLRRHDDCVGAVEPAAIARGHRAALARGLLEELQPLEQHRRLHLVETGVHAELRVTIASRLSAVSRRRTWSATRSSLVVTAPPSPSAPRFLVG